MENFLSTYKKVANPPDGKVFFNKGVGLVSSFSGKLKANVIDLQTAFCIVEIKNTADDISGRFSVFR